MNRILNKVISYLALIGGLVGLYVFYKNMSTMGAVTIWILFTIVGIYSNGFVARMIHMSRVKMEYISYEEEYDSSDWHDRDLGWGNLIPIVMETQYQTSLRPLVAGMLAEYEEEEVPAPKAFKVANLLLTSRIFIVLGVFLMFSGIILPKLLNDYTLYWGMASEQFVTTVLGFAVALHLMVLTLYNYTAFNLVDFSMEGRAVVITNRMRKWFLTASLVFVAYTSLMVIMIMIMGITGFTLPILRTIINPQMVNLLVVVAPLISFIQALILRGKMSSYQYLLNEELS